MTTVDYKVYVACLESYNNGELVGEWVDLTDHDEESFVEKVNEIIEGEEWAFHDYDLPFSIGEYEPIFQLFEKVEAFNRLLEDLPLDLAEEVVSDLGEDYWVAQAADVMWFGGENIQDLAWQVAELMEIDMENNPFAYYMTSDQWEHWLKQEHELTIVRFGYDTVYAYEIV